MSTTIAIDRLALQACFFKLAKAILTIELRDASAIHIKQAVAELTEDNAEAAAAWRDAVDDLQRHLTNQPARLRLQEEFRGKRIV